MDAVGYELARDLLADEIADAGAGCIARVARTATSPRAWRMVAADLAHWQHPDCPAGWEKALAEAARRMAWAKGGPEAAVAHLDEHTGEGTAIVELRRDAIVPTSEPVSAAEARAFLGASAGPWRVAPSDNGLDILAPPMLGERDRSIAVVLDPYEGSHPPYFNTDADARLIAAAPRLRDTVIALHAEVARLAWPYRTCSACGGDGTKDRARCTACRGDGTVEVRS